MSMTDKLAIVKEFGCGASRPASVLCERSREVGCFFSPDYVHLEMFAQHSASSSETGTSAPSDNSKLQNPDQLISHMLRFGRAI